MKLAALCALTSLVLATAAVQAQSTCDASAASRDMAHLAEIRTALRAVKQADDDIGYDVPPAVQQQLPVLKDVLATTVRDVLACTPADAQLPPAKPAAIEAKLAALMHANAPQPPDGSVRKDDPRYREFLSTEWSSNLQVHVTAPRPDLLQVEMSFTIACGYDTVLLLFAHQGNGWHEVLRWQAPPYKQVNGAFGDGFFTTILTPAPGEWRLVAIHGHPWCSSRFSGFNIDVLAATGDAERPRLVWETERGSSRGGDYPERLRLITPDTFEFRDHADAMFFDENEFERTVIYRYKLIGDTVKRLEPIATSARYFVDEWLTMPWDEARAQDAADAPDMLAQVQALSHRDDKSQDRYVQWQNGPVRACAAKGVFQVQMDVSETVNINLKAGGETRALPTQYFQLREGNGGYEMVAVTTKPNPACGGPDLMAGK